MSETFELQSSFFQETNRYYNAGLTRPGYRAMVFLCGSDNELAESLKCFHDRMSKAMESFDTEIAKESISYIIAFPGAAVLERTNPPVAFILANGSEAVAMALSAFGRKPDIMRTLGDGPLNP